MLFILWVPVILITDELFTNYLTVAQSFFIVKKRKFATTTIKCMYKLNRKKSTKVY